MNKRAVFHSRCLLRDKLRQVVWRCSSEISGLYSLLSASSRPNSDPGLSLLFTFFAISSSSGSYSD